MRKLLTTGILSGVLCFSGPAGAAGPVNVNADLSFMSQYAWRGMSLNDDPVFQPSVTLGLGNFSLNVWGNLDFTGYNGTEREFNEIDYTLDYTVDLSSLSLSLGAMYYHYSGLPGFEPTTELYVGLESALPGNPALILYQDVDEGEGTYAEIGMAQSLPVAPFASLEASALLGWGSGVHNRYNYEIAGMRGGLTDFSLNLGLPLGIGETLTVAPGASFISVINGDLRKNYDKSIVVFGLSASASF
jgi:hypothetical protein